MKLRLLTQVLMGVAIAFISVPTIAQPRYARNRTYYCDRSPEGIPITFARTPNRGVIQFIRWSSDVLPRPFTPQRRCQEVSDRFQAYRDNGTLKYITTGVMNGEPAICVATRRGGNCTGLLLTLPRRSNPERALLRLLDLRGLDPNELLNQSSGRRIYVDVDDYLNRVPVE